MLDIEQMKDNISNDDITVGKLKEILAHFPDETPVRIWDHYIGYSLNANVFKRTSAKNVKSMIDTKNERSLIFCDDYLVEQIEAGKNPRIITQEEEDSAPFEMKSLML